MKPATAQMALEALEMSAAALRNAMAVMPHDDPYCRQTEVAERNNREAIAALEQEIAQPVEQVGFNVLFQLARSRVRFYQAMFIEDTFLRQEHECAVNAMSISTAKDVLALQNIIAIRNIQDGSEQTAMLGLFKKIIESCCPDDDTRADVAYAIARHLKLDCPCAYATPQEAAAPELVNAWIPIETVPKEVDRVVVYWAEEGEPRYMFDYIEEGRWVMHADHYEHYCMVACPEMTGPKETPPYTHWMPLPAVPGSAT